MRFEVVGADRDTGEDVIVVLHAQHEAEAREKASRRGTLVASCHAFERREMVTSTEPPHAVRSMPDSQEDDRARAKRRRVRRMFAVIAGLIALASVPVVIEAFRQRDLAEHEAKSAAAAARNVEEMRRRTEREMDEQLRRSGMTRADWERTQQEATRRSIEANLRSQREAALRDDPVVRRLIRSYPELESMIMRNGESDRKSMALKLDMLVATGNVSLNDAQYLLRVLR